MRHFFTPYSTLCAWMLLIGLPATHAQQWPSQTRFRDYLGLVNPASVNNDYFLYEYNMAINSHYRAQWINHPETPRTAYLSGEFISGFGGAFELVGGMHVLRDQTGPQSLTGTYFRLGSLLADDPYLGAFSLGFSYGMVQYRVDASDIAWANPDDPNIPVEDILVSRSDLGVGLFYHRRIQGGYFDEDHVYAGVSGVQLFSGRTLLPNNNNLVPLERVPHLHAVAGWYHFFNEDFFMETSVFAKYTPGAPLNVALSARFQPGDVFWAGCGFNWNGIVHLETGLNVPGLLNDDASLKIGYGFDYNVTAFGLDFGTSHEIGVSVLLDTQ